MLCITLCALEDGASMKNAAHARRKTEASKYPRATITLECLTGILCSGSHSTTTILLETIAVSNNGNKDGSQRCSRMVQCRPGQEGHSVASRRVEEVRMGIPSALSGNKIVSYLLTTLSPTASAIRCSPECNRKDMVKW